MITYEDIGVLPLINAWGTVTAIGGSTMEPSVLAAMDMAARQYVVISELQEAAGRYIAQRFGVPGAFICSGAAAGMALAAAACMAGIDPAQRAQLPDTTGMKNEIITFRTMRSNYDQGFRLVGAKVIEIGMSKQTEEWELRRAINKQTAAISYIIEHAHIGALPLEIVIQIAQEANIPVIVDAAAELPPPENLWRFTNAGVDLTIFSGGKDIRGPQSCGIIVGREDLVKACAFHSSPNHAIGRGMKTGKEEIMGMVNAIDLYLSQSFDSEMTGWESQVAFLVNELSSVRGLTARRVCPSDPGIQPTNIPRVYVDWSRELSAMTPLDFKQLLLEQDPRVAVGTSNTGIVLNPQMLSSGEEKIVASTIQNVLR